MKPEPVRSVGKSVRCALLAAEGRDYLSLFILATPGIEFVTLDGRALGLADAPNPFALPVVDTADVALVSTSWYRWLDTRYPESIPSVFRAIERAATVAAGFDTADWLGLSLPPGAFDRFAVVLAANGIYRDRDLYNYEVGLPFPGGSRTEKIHPRKERYGSEALEKLRLSIPWFIRDVPAVRRAIRERERGLATRLSRVELLARDVADAALRYAQMQAPLDFRRQDVHCMVTLSHIQRLEVLKNLSQFSGVQGISSLPEIVCGTASPDELTVDARNAFLDEVTPLLRKRASRPRYLWQLTRHRIGVAPVGWGEVTFRHAEVLRSGAALVCESLDHVEMLFSFKEDRNAVFYQSDLSDLSDRVRELLADHDRRVRIARAGRRDLASWESRWREHLDVGVARPLREALGWPSGPLSRPLGNGAVA